MDEDSSILLMVCGGALILALNLVFGYLARGELQAPLHAPQSNLTLCAAFASGQASGINMSNHALLCVMNGTGFERCKAEAALQISMDQKAQGCPSAQEIMNVSMITGVGR